MRYLQRPNINALALGFLTLLLVACGREDVEPVAGVTKSLATSRAERLSDITYRLTLSIPEDPAADIAGKLAIEFELANNRAPLQLDFRESPDKIRSVLTNGDESSTRVVAEHLLIPAAELVPGKNTVEIEFVAGSSSLNRNPEYVYTLFVPDRARTAFPLFDQPDLKATFVLSLDVPEQWVAMSNAGTHSVQTRNGRNQYEFAATEKISSYLFSFVAGRFETVSRTQGGRTFTMLHRETDAEKVSRNIDAVFALHASSLNWLEDYTGIDYPYSKFGFALIPAFQYGGMEHVGAIQYRADSLFLDEAPSDTQLLGRASLIAHETAHMWFGNLVTMEWFNDVWTKEVFANFMAAKIVNPDFPDIDHNLNFLVRHYPRAYSVDRTPGANPIRQSLGNLNEAGQMYGAIIYNKAPIMMRQLEAVLGEELFRRGLQAYLTRFSFDNATWPDLIDIFDATTDVDLREWSQVWVNSAGRPSFSISDGALTQTDPANEGRIWPQRFSMAAPGGESAPLSSDKASVDLPAGLLAIDEDNLISNADGMGYGLFPADPGLLQNWEVLDGVEKGSLLINLFENFLNANGPAPDAYLEALTEVVTSEENQLIVDLALRQLRRVYWSFLSPDDRLQQSQRLARVLWQRMMSLDEPSKRKVLFLAFADVALLDADVQAVFEIWSGERIIDDLPLSENDRLDLAQLLATKRPQDGDDIVARQLEETENPDNVRKLEFIAPSLSADRSVRDEFFESLAREENRQTESWVLDALANLHHPLRVEDSERYLQRSLELLSDIQATGDIFFPKRWLDETLVNHRSATAVKTVQTFLDERPDYNAQLRMKILQSADMMVRAQQMADR